MLVRIYRLHAHTHTYTYNHAIVRTTAAAAGMPGWVGVRTAIILYHARVVTSITESHPSNARSTLHNKLHKYTTPTYNNPSLFHPTQPKIGRASCRERVCQYV